jgi:hypothetical protein
MGIMEPSWPARSPLPILEPRQARPALESDGRTSTVRGSLGRGDSEATSNRSLAMSRKRRPLRRGVTCRNKTRTAPERPGQLTAGYGQAAHPLHVSSILSFSDEARFILAASPSLLVRRFVASDRSSSVASRFARPPALWENGGASLTGFCRATHAWDRLSAGTPAHAVTAVTAVPHCDPATACRSLGGHGPAVTAMTTVIVGIRIARAVTAVIIVLEVTAATRQAFVTRPGGHGPL